jgi:hypothetical protein
VKFEDLVDRDDLTPEEEAKLRRVHELLVEAGPPPDLPPALEHPTAPVEAEVVEYPFLARRRNAALAIVAIAATLAALAGGYAWGHSQSKPSSLAAERTVPMHGAAGRLAVITVGAPDKAGNWPMLVAVSGLPTQANPRAYYELWLTRNGKPVAPCGGFRVHGTTTTVTLSVPYRLSRYDGWVVTAQVPAPGAEPGPGPVVLTT